MVLMTALVLATMLVGGAFLIVGSAPARSDHPLIEYIDGKGRLVR